MLNIRNRKKKEEAIEGEKVKEEKLRFGKFGLR